MRESNVLKSELTMELGITHSLSFLVGSFLAQGAVAVERAHDSLSGSKDSLSFQKGSNLGVGDTLLEERFSCDPGVGIASESTAPAAKRASDCRCWHHCTRLG